MSKQEFPMNFRMEGNIMSDYVRELREIQNLTDEKIQEMKKNKLATEIVELFEELLDRKGIEIPCDDKDEQKDRNEGNNTAKLYGMEYLNLVSDIQNLL